MDSQVVSCQKRKQFNATGWYHSVRTVNNETYVDLRAFGGQTVKKLRRLAWTFDFDQNERKSLQFNASARRTWPNEVASRCKFPACDNFRTCLSVWPGRCQLKFHGESIICVILTTLDIELENDVMKTSKLNVVRF